MTDNKLTPQQSAFVDHFCESGSASDAYSRSGYKPNASNAAKLVTRLSAEINGRLQARMALTTGVCLNVLESIIKDPEAHNRDKLSAIGSWLDRSGIARTATQNIALRHTDVSREPRRVIRNGTEYVAVGEGVMFPPKNDGDDTLFDYSDEETARYLQDNSH